MGYLEGRPHREVVFDFVPITLLPFLSTTQRKKRDSYGTFKRLAVLGSMSLRTSRTSCTMEDPTWPCFMTKDFGVSAAGDATGPLRCVRFLRLRAIRPIVDVVQQKPSLFDTDVPAKQRLP
jgi:hypothetical protein